MHRCLIFEGRLDIRLEKLQTQIGKLETVHIHSACLRTAMARNQTDQATNPFSDESPTITAEAQKELSKQMSHNILGDIATSHLGWTLEQFNNCKQAFKGERGYFVIKVLADLVEKMSGFNQNEVSHEV